MTDLCNVRLCLAAIFAHAMVPSVTTDVKLQALPRLAFEMADRFLEEWRKGNP